MPQQAGSAVTNNFANGLVTEATGLNFPENACTETSNCVFNLDGSVERRLGFDFENNYSTKAIDTTGGVINSFLWRDVAGNGTIYLYVVQVGTKLYFYNASSTDPVSAHAINSTIDLTDFSPSGAPSPASEECQFSSGNGLLFVTHPVLEAFYVSYDTNTQTVTGTQIDLKIRDLKGMDDVGVAVDLRVTASVGGTTTAHLYNLLNQGWTTTNLATWDAGRTDIPSNADVMWRFKNSSDAFDITTVANQVAGNSPAPKGHYILNVFNEDRATAASLAISNVTTSYHRASTNAFFAGRVFYAGINYEGYNSNIYFTQVIERPEQYGYCYQTNDPTAEDLFDLLPTDGGVIVIREAGTIIKMVSIPGGLAVFASNGVWLITGSTGLGFSATDYTVSKISSIRTLTHTSFVDIAGAICWWNLEGIYLLSAGGQGGGTQIKSLTHDKILSYYYDIPPSSKRAARGYFNTVTGTVQWLYRSTEAATIEEIYQYDRILNLNTFINAFYPWTITTSGGANLCGIVVVENLGGSVSVEQIVTDLSENVVDDNGTQVVAYTINDGIVVPKFKYLVYYDDSGDRFTIAEERSSTYTDWVTLEEASYQSLFVSGYRIRGDAIRRYQPLYLKIYSNNEVDSEYIIRGIWDYATSGNTGRWSPSQLIVHNTDNYSNLSKKIKIRGHGMALQFRVESNADAPFHLIGWSTFDVGNPKP